MNTTTPLTQGWEAHTRAIAPLVASIHREIRERSERLAYLDRRMARVYSPPSSAADYIARKRALLEAEAADQRRGLIQAHLELARFCDPDGIWERGLRQAR